MSRRSASIWANFSSYWLFWTSRRSHSFCRLQKHENMTHSQNNIGPIQLGICLCQNRGNNRETVHGILVFCNIPASPWYCMWLLFIPTTYKRRETAIIPPLRHPRKNPACTLKVSDKCSFPLIAMTAYNGMVWCNNKWRWMMIMMIHHCHNSRVFLPH